MIIVLIQHLLKDISGKVENTAEKTQLQKQCSNITQADTWGNNGHCANQQYCHNSFCVDWNLF